MRNNNNFCSYKDYKRELRKPLEEKVEDTKDIVAERLGQFGYNCYVAWSGGKDSTLVLWFALKYLPDVPVVFNNTGVEHPETIEFVRKTVKAWDINLTETRPEKTFWQCVEEYGWPEYRSPTSKRGGGKPRCCYFLKERPMYDVIKEKKFSASLDGVTASESQQRRLLLIRHGYCHNTGKDVPWRMQKIHPLWHWKPEDVWEYISQKDIPYNPIYDKGVPRCGCMACTGHLGWKSQIAKTNPGLLRMMMKKMGQETLL